MDVKDKVALVTGGAHRVGKHISIALAKAGAKLAIHHNRATEEGTQTLAELHALGVEATLFQGDFTAVRDVERVVNECTQQFGRVDILVNNAAAYFKTPLLQTSEEEWDTLFSVNLKAVYFCSQFVAAGMLQRKSGKIINIADVAAMLPWPDFIPYCTTKAGVIALTKGLAQALGPTIQVNAIASGTVLLSEDTSSKERRKLEKETLLKRIGTPQDIANTVLFLLQGGDYITGEVIAVDGGRLLAV